MLEKIKELELEISHLNDALVKSQKWSKIKSEEIRLLSKLTSEFSDLISECEVIGDYSQFQNTLKQFINIRSARIESDSLVRRCKKCGFEYSMMSFGSTIDTCSKCNKNE